jgi:hypothetical protein
MGPTLPEPTPENGVGPVQRRILTALVLGLLILSLAYLALGSVRDVQCEVLDARSGDINMSGNAGTMILSRSVTIRFACTYSGWIPLSNVTAEIRIAEKDREVGGGWYTAGDLIAVQQLPLGTLESGTPVVKTIRFRGLNWSRDVGIRIRPYQV